MKNIFTKEIEKRKIFEYCVFSILFHNKEKMKLDTLERDFLCTKKDSLSQLEHVFRGNLNSLA